MSVACKVILTASAATAPRFHPYFGSASAFVVEILDGVTPAGEDVFTIARPMSDIHLASPRHSGHDAVAQLLHASTERSLDWTRVEPTEDRQSGVF